jgi:hypothetical protein
MVWPHWHHERWATIGCGKPKWVHNVVKKWANDKRNVGVVGWVNNQAPAPGPAHEWRCACVIFEGAPTRREANSCFVSNPPKKPPTRGKFEPLGSQRVGHHLNVLML